MPKQKTLTIADLCREIDRDPKIVRAKLRRIYKKNPSNLVLPEPVEGKWTFKASDRSKLEALIVGAA